MIGGSLLGFHLGGLLRFAVCQLPYVHCLREKDSPMVQQLNDVPIQTHRKFGTTPTIYQQISSLALR